MRECGGNRSHILGKCIARSKKRRRLLTQMPRNQFLPNSNSGCRKLQHVAVDERRMLLPQVERHPDNCNPLEKHVWRAKKGGEGKVLVANFQKRERELESSELSYCSGGSACGWFPLCSPPNHSWQHSSFFLWTCVNNCSRSGSHCGSLLGATPNRAASRQRLIMKFSQKISIRYELSHNWECKPWHVEVHVREPLGLFLGVVALSLRVRVRVSASA